MCNSATFSPTLIIDITIQNIDLNKNISYYIAIPKINKEIEIRKSIFFYVHKIISNNNNLKLDNIVIDEISSESFFNL